MNSAATPITTSELERALRVATQAAKEAGAFALEGFRRGAEIRLKGEIDLVTEYDEGAERLIRGALTREFPFAVVGEEAGRTEASAGAGGLVWYVDPIDGTTNFAHGHPFFCVSIGLYTADAEPLLGVVYAPALQTLWSGARGRGVTRNGEPVRVSSRDTLMSSLCATGFPYDRRESTDDNVREYRAVLKRVRGIRRCGSAALDLALVADGTYDGYWEQRLGVWDMAGGAALVHEAGGTLTDYDGSPADVRRGRLVATNGLIHEALRGVLFG